MLQDTPLEGAKRQFCLYGDAERLAIFIGDVLLTLFDVANLMADRGG